ncbi:protein of unknown function [Candidatus Promineifilum breve]|uniref:Uncharacterized protein n=1 Tax=Candidatus Promineifilum breve TaxID=1806508 RepID=A0A160T905_9CHLR|nr:class I SAM-dependent methyltransferase [Candidatus Promineifilum breve]CUS05918.1 protein of unknown function [Candidatus Promineifilum breve]
MTPYELLFSASIPFLPALYGRARRDIRRLIVESGLSRPCVLDVGGRKSPYTVGLPADVTILDMPRESELQEQLDLGLTNNTLRHLRHRSNIGAVILQDMTRSNLPSASYDGVICVEVIEHVVADDAFVRQIARVLKPGGWAYFTTPNGDYIRNAPPDYNPDHVKHFRRQELHDLLALHFDAVDVRWGIKTGKYRYLGLRTLTPRHPLSTAQAMAGNVISGWESRGLDEQPQRTAHLLAMARKRA